MVPFACTFKTFCACTAYSIIIGDSFSSLFGATPGASVRPPIYMCLRYFKTNFSHQTTVLILKLQASPPSSPSAPT